MSYGHQDLIPLYRQDQTKRPQLHRERESGNDRVQDANPTAGHGQ